MLRNILTLTRARVSAFGVTAFAITISALAINTFCVINVIQLVDKPFPGFLLNQRLVFYTVGSPYWTGPQAGLKYPDKILTANGHPVGSSEDLGTILKETKPGDAIRYTFDRAGQVIDLTISTMTFSLADFFMTFGIPFIMGLVYLILGAIVYIMKPDKAVSKAHLIFCVLLSVYSTTSPDNTLPAQINLFVHGMLPGAFVHLSLLFPEQWKVIARHPTLHLIPYLISMALAIPLVILYPNPAFVTIYALGFLYLIVGAGTLTVSTLRATFTKSFLARQRAKIVLLGSAFAFPLPSLGIFLSLFGSHVTGVAVQGNLIEIPLIIFPMSIAYAIVQHNLFDVDVYIKRTVGYVIMTIIVALTYFSMQTAISTMVLIPLLGENASKVYPIVFALLIVFLFNPIQQRVQEAVDRMFFRKQIDYKETVNAVSNALNSLLNLEEIIRQVIHTVRSVMFIDTVGVVVLDQKKKQSRAYFVAEGTGSLNDLANISVNFDDPLLTLLAEEKKLITKYDIREDPRYAHLRETCGQRFSETGTSLAIPLIYQNEFKGALAVGYKKSGHFYTREDIDLLTTLANQGAVAIENAKMAEHMLKQEMVRTNLARYLSPQIVDQIMQKDVKVNLGGDRKVVTVLFSDIRNFTTITESRPADQLVQILNEYFTEMAGIIFENQGSLDKYIGDAIVAVFGSLIPLKNTASSAVTAAIQMMKRLPVLNDRWMKEYGFTMNIGIGISTGEVFLGNIGSPERMEFTVIGDTVNVASRFSGLAKPGQVLATRATFNCLGPDVPYKELVPTEVKGKTGKLEVFEILYA